MCRAKEKREVLSKNKNYMCLCVYEIYRNPTFSLFYHPRCFLLWVERSLFFSLFIFVIWQKREIEQIFLCIHVSMEIHFGLPDVLDSLVKTGIKLPIYWFSIRILKKRTFGEKEKSVEKSRRLVGLGRKAFLLKCGITRFPFLNVSCM